MERYEIEAFLTLADELHFSRTAQRLRVSQGRVSQTIKKLERRIGAPLFDRSSRHVTLTPLGQQLRTDLEPHHRGIQDAINRAIDAAPGITGLLRVGFTAPWSGQFTLQAADRFRARYPDCTVEIHEATYYTAFAMLRDGELDLLLGETPMTEERPDITAGPTIFSTTRALAVPADHPLAAQQTVSLEDLARAPLIRPTGFSQALLDRHYPQHTPTGQPIPPGPKVLGFQEMLTLVGAGQGVTLVSVNVADFHARTDIAVVPFHDAPPVEYALLWSTNRATTKVDAFARIAAKLADSTGSDH